MYLPIQENRGCDSGSQVVCCEICFGVTPGFARLHQNASPLPTVRGMAARRLAPDNQFYKSRISDYMNHKDNSPDNNAGKTRRKKLPPEALRSCTVTTKMTAAEREKIHDIAAGCNLTPSDYMRQRALGYEPPSALTAEESALLHNLDGCRVDILNFANALAGMKHDARIILFQKVSFMLDWYRLVVPITNAVTEFLNSVINGGRLSPRTRKTIIKI